MKPRKLLGWARNPRTQQERRINCYDREYVRGKRLPNSLPNSYDDIRVRPRKTWKDKRKTQYRVDDRGGEHSLVLDSCIYTWRLEEYLRDMDIPYRLEENYDHKMVRWFHYKKTVKPGHLREYPWDIHKWEKVYTDEYRRVCYLAGYTLTWWSDKNIGIDFILRKFSISS